MILDEIDKKILIENYDKNLLNQIDPNNVYKICNY